MTSKLNIFKKFIFIFSCSFLLAEDLKVVLLDVQPNQGSIIVILIDEGTIWKKNKIEIKNWNLAYLLSQSNNPQYSLYLSF